jgi:hypothetical protein
MDEVLDLAKPDETPEPVNLKRSAKLARMCFLLFNVWLVVSLIKVFVSFKFPAYVALNLEVFFAIVIFLAGLGIFVVSPIGLFYSVQSYRKREGGSRPRLRYTIVHAFFCLILVLYVPSRIAPFLGFILN